MKILANSSTPIFQQIAAGLRERIAAGIYREGEALPSLRVLAVELKVNPNTVQRAYDLLQREGIVTARRGLGAFVSKRGVNAACAAAEESLHDALATAIGNAFSAGMSASRVRSVFSSVMTEQAKQVAR